jgi:peptidoglycan/xylan/chitin deacetylase (PgdA/CDA1 family)
MQRQQIRNVAIRVCITGFYYGGLVAFARRRMRRQDRHLIILNYHRATDSDLRSHLRYLRRYYRLLPLDVALAELYGCANDTRPLHDRRTPLVVTFDDGYYDNYTHAAALAKELQVPLTIFLIPAYVESGARFWWYEGDCLVRDARVAAATIQGRTYDLRLIEERQAASQAIYDFLYWAPSIAERETFLQKVRQALAIPAPDRMSDGPLRPLTWAEVREMEASGWITFGAHTLHHPVLAHLVDADEINREVVECRMVLDGHLLQRVRTFAYPFGRPEHIGNEGLHAVRDAGYDWAVTTLRGVNTAQTDPHLLRRIMVGTDRNWRELAADIAGVWPAFARAGRAILGSVGLGQPSSRSISYQTRGDS